MFDARWFALVGCLLLVGVYAFFTERYRYWRKRGVFFVEPSFPFGNFRDGVTRTSSGEVMMRLYDAAKGRDFFGFWLLHRPVLMVRDPELVKQILVKDFQHFSDRAVYVDEETDPLSGHLFALKGEKWKFLRAKLTPTFTSGKMKMMFPIICELSGEMINHLRTVRESAGEVEMGEIHAGFTTDVIAACAFGIRTNSIADSGSEFRRMGRRIFEPSFGHSLRVAVLFMLPKLAENLKLRIIPEEVSKFFMNAVRETIELRESSGVLRRDFMQLLIQLKNNGRDAGVKVADEGITVEQAAAQAFVFFMAGFETSSTTMTYAVYELALNQDLQENLREEMDRTVGRHGGEITYEGVQEMVLLDKVVSEVLRKYPPVSALNRQCVKEYRIPGTDVIVEAGTLVMVSVLGLHRDEEHYPNPTEFDPERFSDEAKAKRHRFAYLPFGEGPRACIGLRFGLMQTKIGLTSLVREFRLRLSSRTAVPLRFDPNSIVMTPAGGVWVELQPRIGERLPTYNDVLELIVMNKIQRGDFDELAEQMTAVLGPDCDYLCDEDCDYSSDDGECQALRAEGESSKKLLSAGYTDCMDEAIRFLVEEENISPEHPVVRNLRAHLEESRERILETVAEMDALSTGRIQRSVEGRARCREYIAEPQCAWNTG